MNIQGVSGHHIRNIHKNPPKLQELTERVRLSHRKALFKN